MSVPPLSTSALAEFNASLSEYLVWAKKKQGPAIEDRGRKVRFELFKVFKRIAKTPAQIRAEAASHGFQIKRRVEGKLAAEYPAAAAVGAVPRVSVEEELKLRGKSAKFLSVSWLFRSWKAAQSGQTGRFAALNRARKVIGSALVNTAEGREDPSVSLMSFLAGVVAQNRERNLVDAALRNQARDMATYIARKHQEHMQRTFTKTYAVALGAIA